MRRFLTVLVVCASATTAFAQAGFDCAPLGLMPLHPTLSCEGVCSNNNSALTTVSAASSCGFPVSGPRYAVIGANGPVAAGPGGPIARPLAAAASEVRVPIPAGATTVSFSWDFYNAEIAPTATFNDGLSIDVVTPAGTLVGALVYADTFTAAAACEAVPFSAERAPAGPNVFVGVLPAHAVCDYISISVWNGGDNDFSSHAYVDSIAFDAAGGGCLPPAFTPPPNDTCATAIVISAGVATSGNNVVATTGPDPVSTCGGQAKDLWYAVIPSCSGTHTVSTCQPGTDYDTVVGVWDGTGGCGGLVALACNDDNCSLGQGLSSSVTFAATAGTTYYISVGGYLGANGNFTLLVSAGGGMVLSFITGGPGCMGYAITGGPQGGSAFTAITLTAGAYPVDWFFGIAISLSDIGNQFSQGFPFVVGLGSCGNVSVGPFCGLPSGLVAYGVSLGIPSGGSLPTLISAPATGTVP